jgi:uncharacterized protein YegP (UPF0339 family)
MSKFQVYKDAAGKFRFRLRAGNNQIVAVGEAYEQHASCINGIRSIQKNCKAEIEDLTINDRKIPNPKYQIYKDAKDEFRFRLKAPNGEIIAEGEGYESKAGCLNGIEVVRGSGDAEIEDLSITKKPRQDNVSEKIEEVESSPKTIVEDSSGARKTKEVEVNAPKIEEVTPPVNVEAKTDIEAVLPEVTREELPQHLPLMPVETEIPPESYPVETRLELYPVPQGINKGNYVTLRGKLSSNSGRGISGAKIRIYERDRSILGDDYLAYGTTGEDGVFTIAWKARSLSWRKTNGDIYAAFAGNERAKPQKSDIQTVSIT